MFVNVLSLGYLEQGTLLRVDRLKQLINYLALYWAKYPSVLKVSPKMI